MTDDSACKHVHVAYGVVEKGICLDCGAVRRTYESDYPYESDKNLDRSYWSSGVAALERRIELLEDAIRRLDGYDSSYE